MRVAIDVKSVALHGTGVAVYTQNLVGLLARSNAGGHTYLLIGPTAALDALPDAAHFEKHALKLVRFAGSLRIPLYDQLGLLLLIRRVGADVLVTPNCDAPVCARVPTLVVIHDTAYLRFPRWYPASYRLYYGFLLRWHMTRAAVVATDSNFAREEIKAFGRSAAVYIVPCPIEPEFFMPESGEPADMPVVTTPYVLYSGGADARKDLAFLWAGFSSACTASGFDAALVVTGSDPRLSVLSVAADRAGLGDRVHLVGHLTRRAIRRLYAGAAAVVFTSKYEGFGLPVLEALAAGTEVVTTPVGIATELNGDLVTIVKSGDSDALGERLAAAVAADAARRRRIRQDGPRRAREFLQGTATAFEAALQAACRRAA